MNYKKLLCSACAGLLLLTGSGCNSNNNKEEIIKEEENIEEIIPKKIDYYDINYFIDTSRYEEEYDNLRINEYRSLPYNTYKVLRYVDFNNYERVAIVNTYVNFMTDENKNITREYYNIYDAFSGDFLLSTYDISSGNKYDDGEVYYILSYGDLLDLKDIAESKGLNSEYTDSIMSDDIKRKSITTDEAAFDYLMLVTANERYQNKNEELVLEK